MTGVVRLFYFYSSLLNIADEAHAHRKRREQVRGKATFWFGACQELQAGTMLLVPTGEEVGS